MGKRAQYQTKQMTEILACLKTSQGRHITVSDIEQYFKNHGISVGKTTIYRQLERMVVAGTVAKYNISGSDSACFEYVGETDHPGEAASYHCKCKQCGELFHLQCSEIAGLEQHMLKEHEFLMDPVHTVFYGICRQCRQSGEG